MNNGWIKLHRKFLNWEWFDDPLMVQIWIYLILECNHAEKKWMGTTIRRGQCIIGLDKMSKTLNISKQKLRGRLAKLEKTGEINKQSNTRFTLITICKYDRYQIKDAKDNTPNNKPITNEQQTNNKRITVNKNVKKDKNDKKERREFVFLSDTELETLIEKYGKSTTEKMIEKLDNYKGSTGKKYKSDYRAILSWVVKDFVTELPDKWSKDVYDKLKADQQREYKNKMKKLGYRDHYCANGYTMTK